MSAQVFCSQVAWFKKQRSDAFTICILTFVLPFGQGACPETAPTCNTALRSIPVTRMSCEREARTENPYIQNELVRAHLSLLVPENAPAEGKIDSKLSWLFFARSSTLSGQQRHEEDLVLQVLLCNTFSLDLQCHFAHFWHLKRFTMSTALLLLLFLLFSTEILQIFFFNSPRFRNTWQNSAEAGIYAFKTDLHTYYSCNKEGS